MDNLSEVGSSATQVGWNIQNQGILQKVTNEIISNEGNDYSIFSKTNFTISIGDIFGDISISNPFSILSSTFS